MIPDPLGMLNTATGIHSRITKAQSTAHELKRIVEIAAKLHASSGAPVGFYIGGSSTGWFQDPHGTIKEAALASLADQIKRHYEEIEALGCMGEVKKVEDDITF